MLQSVEEERKPAAAGTNKLTFDCVQHSVVQRFPTRIVGGGADPCSTAVGQSVSMETRIINQFVCDQAVF